MHDQRFDVLARSLGSATSRRQMLKVLAGGAVGGLGVLVSRRRTVAESGGNSACASFCDTTFAPGPDRGACKSAGAHGQGLCFTACGPNGPAGQTGTLCGGPSLATTTCCTNGVTTCISGTCCPNTLVCGSTCLAAPCNLAQCQTCNPSTGTCSSACSAGQTCCSGTCKNLQTDTNNCGSCGTVCASGQTCQSGKCVSPTTATTVDFVVGCGPNVADPQTCMAAAAAGCPDSAPLTVTNGIVDFSVSTNGALAVDIIMGGCCGCSHCSPVELAVYVDDVKQVTTPPLGPGADSGLINLGPVSPGTHKVGFQGIGVAGGCNAGALFSWGAKGSIFTS